MDNSLISKKELLEMTGISYGQLYRWKRKQLIPEEWFIRKSTFTGQETFFPRDKILARIEKISNMKEGLSLDDIAEALSPNLADIFLKKSELVQRNIVTQMTVDFYLDRYGEVDDFSFEKILHMAVLERLLQKGEINLEEGNLVIGLLHSHYHKFKDKNCELVFLRKFGISSCFLAATPNEIQFDEATKVVERVNLTECIEALKEKLK